MAAIGSIRKRSGLLVLIIGLAIVGFLVMDITNNNFGVLGGANQQTSSVGSIDGETIDYTFFEREFEKNLDNFRQQKGAGYEMAEDERMLVREQTWNDLIRQVVFKNIYEELGLTVSEEEKADMLVGKNIHPEIQRAFSNPQTGQFDPSQVRFYINNLDTEEEGAEPGDKRRRWETFLKFLVDERQENKYKSLIHKGLYVPEWQAAMVHKDNSEAVNFDYVMVPYADIANTEIALDDKALEAHLKKYAKRYKQDPTRAFSYVSWNILPSKDDSLVSKQYVNSKKADFSKAKNDSVFVRIYSEVSMGPAFLKKEELPIKSLADTLMTADTGKVMGPFLTSRGYELVKVSERKKIADSVKVRHILFTGSNLKSQEEVPLFLAMVDSVFMALDSLGADFGKLATKYSEDPGSAEKAGDLGWAKPGQMVPSFNNAIFYRAKVGQIMKVRSQFGIHILQVTESNPTREAVRVAYLSHSIVPSAQTENDIAQEAGIFAGQKRSKADFQAAFEAFPANAKRAVGGVKEMDYNVLGLGVARDLVQWVFKAELDEVSYVLPMDNRLVVAMVTEVNEGGLPSVSEVRDQLSFEVAKVLKKDLVASKIDGMDLNAIAQQFGRQVGESQGLTMINPNIPEVGPEPAVIATAAGLENGVTSAAIEGNAGVFVIRVKGKATTNALSNYGPFKAQMESKYLATINNDLFNGLKEKAEIKDNRSFFY